MHRDVVSARGSSRVLYCTGGTKAYSLLSTSSLNMWKLCCLLLNRTITCPLQLLFSPEVEYLQATNLYYFLPWKISLSIQLCIRCCRKTCFVKNSQTEWKASGRQCVPAQVRLLRSQLNTLELLTQSGFAWRYRRAFQWNCPRVNIVFVPPLVHSDWTTG